MFVFCKCLSFQDGKDTSAMVKTRGVKLIAHVHHPDPDGAVPGIPDPGIPIQVGQVATLGGDFLLNFLNSVYLAFNVHLVDLSHYLPTLHVFGFCERTAEARNQFYQYVGMIEDGDNRGRDVELWHITGMNTFAFIVVVDAAQFHFHRLLNSVATWKVGRLLKKYFRIFGPEVDAMYIINASSTSKCAIRALRFLFLNSIVRTRVRVFPRGDETWKAPVADWVVEQELPIVYVRMGQLVVPVAL